MTPTEKSLYAERIHDVWRKASRMSGKALRAAYQADNDGTPPLERYRLMKRAEHLLARSNMLARAEVHFVLGA